MTILHKKLSKSNKEKNKRKQLKRWLQILKQKWKLKELKMLRNLLIKKQILNYFKMELQEMKKPRRDSKLKFWRQNKVPKTSQQTR
jgi:hypothetical protein